MNNKASIFKYALNYGSLIGLGMITVSFVFYLLDMSDSMVGNLLSYIIMIILLVLGCRNYRDQESGGYISYGKSFSLGILMVIVAAVILSIFTYVLLTYIDPNLLQTSIEKAEQMLIEKGISEEYIEKQMYYTRKYSTPILATLWSFLGILFIGLIFTLITSAFIKKANKSFE